MTTAGEIADVRLANVALTLGAQKFRFDCTLPGGAITAITGPSGSGKSTLLNLVAGFETPDAGRIAIGGRDVQGLHPSARPLSLVFQDNNLFAHLDLFSNIGLGISPALKLGKEDRERIGEALERVGLKGFDKRYPGTLSGGERQRAAFARALVRRRPVLLLDEPFAALDPALRQTMADLLLDLHRETGNTVAIVTHDSGTLRHLADHAIFIEAGEVRLQADIASFLTRGDVPGLAAFLTL
ncbi:ATP-binding cassette domain-containing protein [Neorhizobium sp. NPDC001467]|uniref:thiamine ABC transporter ATP-binding protein n=1 Tax=Neorhizobium sp. NPDC001467 TaxID=3390595 RepID=UPI003D08AD44